MFCSNFWAKLGVMSNLQHMQFNHLSLFTQAKKKEKRNTIKLRKCRCQTISTVFLLCLWSSSSLSLLCPAVDCVMSAWTAWSQCSVSCGLGSLFRQRKILRDARPGGSCGGGQFDSRACFLQACPGECYFSNWGFFLILSRMFSSYCIIFWFFHSVGNRMLNDPRVPLILASFRSVFYFPLFLPMSLLTLFLFIHSSLSFSSLSFYISQWMDSGLSGVSGQSVMLNVGVVWR